MTRIHRNVRLNLSAEEIQEGMFLITHDGVPHRVLGVTRSPVVTLELDGGATRVVSAQDRAPLAVLFPQAMRARDVRRGDRVNVRGALAEVTGVRHEAGRVLVSGEAFCFQADPAGFVNVTPPLGVAVMEAVQSALRDLASCSFTLTDSSLRVYGGVTVSPQVLAEDVRAALRASCAALTDEQGREVLFVHVPRAEARAFDDLANDAHTWRPGGHRVILEPHWDEAFTLTCGRRSMDFLMRGRYATCRAGVFDLTLPVERSRALSTVLPGTPVSGEDLALLGVPDVLRETGYTLHHVGTVSFGGGLLVSELMRLEHPDGRVLSACTSDSALLVGGVPAAYAGYGWTSEDEILFGMSDEELAADGLTRPAPETFHPDVWRLRRALLGEITAALDAGTLIEGGELVRLPGQLPHWREGSPRSNLSADEQAAANDWCRPQARPARPVPAEVVTACADDALPF